MKPEREPTLPLFCPSCEREVYVSVAKLRQHTVGVVYTSCRQQIPLTACPRSNPGQMSGGVTMMEGHRGAAPPPCPEAALSELDEVRHGAHFPPVRVGSQW